MNMIFLCGCRETP